MLKDLLVVADDAAGCSSRLTLAASLARRYDAHLTGLYVLRVPVAPEYAGSGILDRLVRLYLPEEERKAADARRTFEEITARCGVVKAEWRVDRGDATEQAIVHAIHADLAIVGQVDPSRPAPTMPPLLPEDVIVAAGGPVLVVPAKGRFGAVGTRVLIAWNGSREAARAIHDALPILSGAEAVMVFTVDADRKVPGTPDIVRHLQRHGVKTAVERIRASEEDVVAQLFLRAGTFRADLIVMGAYGHSRTRELVLGGATRDVLQTASIPVLMSH